MDDGISREFMSNEHFHDILCSFVNTLAWPMAFFIHHAYVREKRDFDILVPTLRKARLNIGIV